MIWRLTLILLLIFRLFLATQSKHGDMYNLVVWGNKILESGPSGFYELPKEDFEPYTRPDQPPGSLLLSWFSVLSHSTLGQAITWLNFNVRLFPSKLIPWWPDPGHLVFLKLPGIIADLFIAAAIIRLGQLLARPRLAKVVALVYLLNPALWYNSSFWGQTDSVVAALSIWSLISLLESRLILSASLFGLSLITKPSWAPFLVLWLVYVFKKHHSRISAALFVPISALGLALPFHPRLDLPFWLLNLFLTRFLPGGSSFITVNAFNFWALFFAPNHVPDSIFLAGLPIRLWAYLIALPICLLLLFRFWRSPSSANLVWTSLLVFFTVFLLAPRMHERYSYPVFPLLSLALVYRPDRKLLWFIYGLTSGLYLVNQYHDWWAPYRPYLVALYTSTTPKLVAAGYLLAFLSLVALKSPHAAKS